MWNWSWLLTNKRYDWNKLCETEVEWSLVRAIIKANYVGDCYDWGKPCEIGFLMLSYAPHKIGMVTTTLILRHLSLKLLVSERFCEWVSQLITNSLFWSWEWTKWKSTLFWTWEWTKWKSAFIYYSSYSCETHDFDINRWCQPYQNKCWWCRLWKVKFLEQILTCQRMPKESWKGSIEVEVHGQ